MDILLVKPDIGPIIEDYKLNDGCMEPLALGVLAGLTPRHHQVRLLDDRKERVTGAETADLVAMGGKPHDVIIDHRSRHAYVTLVGVDGPDDYLFGVETALLEVIEAVEGEFQRGDVIEVREVGGLHHHYERVAA